jgi:uncharacterized membrane protein
MASLVGQRVLVKAGMSDEEEDTLQLFDTIYGVSALILVISGYYRVTEVEYTDRKGSYVVFTFILNSVSFIIFYSLGKELTLCTSPCFG